jgi:hypothetical protein
LLDRLHFGDLARQLFLTCGDPVNALPHLIEIERYCVPYTQAAVASNNQTT